LFSLALPRTHKMIFIGADGNQKARDHSRLLCMRPTYSKATKQVRNEGLCYGVKTSGFINFTFVESEADVGTPASDLQHCWRPAHRACDSRAYVDTLFILMCGKPTVLTQIQCILPCHRIWGVIQERV